MAAPDYDVIKEIPGYKVILKAVLKSQIQQLVEQLATSTDEESVILTASVADGTLSHLGSESGKGFLEDHEDIKSQFLGFCLKKHHRKKQEEKERREAEALQQSMQTSPGRFGGHPGPYAARSPRFASPRAQSPLHPIALTRASPGGHIRSPGIRHEPYPMNRPPRMKRTSLNFEQGKGQATGPSQTLRSPSANKLDGQVIKIEPEDDNEASNHSESDTVNQDKPASSSQSPSHQSNAPSSVKSESGEKEDDDAKSESSSSTIPNEPPSEGLGLDSDLSNLISGSNQPHTSESSEIDPNVSVKLEALTENEMELEITGVEPGRPPVPQDNWDPNVSMGMNFDPTGATGSQGDMTAQGYNILGQNRDGQYTDMLCLGFDAKQSEITAQNPSASHFLQPDIGSQPFTRFSDILQQVTEMSPLSHHAKLQQGHCAGSDRPASLCLEQSSVTMVTEETDHSPQDFAGNYGNRERLHCPYKDCGKVFSRKYTLNRHVRNHDGHKMFQCSICGMKCSRKDNLKVHIFNIHKKHCIPELA